MKTGTILSALLAGWFFAAATIEKVDHPEISDIRIIDYPLFYLTLPGFIVAYAISGDVNIRKTSVVAIANFVFYFGIAWLLGRWWEKRRSPSQGASYHHRNSISEHSNLEEGPLKLPVKVLQTMLVMQCMFAAFLLIVYVDCLIDFAPIKPGMTRVQVKRLFPEDGGLQSPSQCRFRHPRSLYFYVTVGFSCNRDAEGRTMISPNDRVTTVSPPYFQHPTSD